MVQGALQVTQATQVQLAIQEIMVLVALGVLLVQQATQALLVTQETLALTALVALAVHVDWLVTQAQ